MVWKYDSLCLKKRSQYSSAGPYNSTSLFVTLNWIDKTHCWNIKPAQTTLKMGVAEFIMIGTKAHGQRGKRSIESLKRHLMENLFSYETNELKADNTEKIWFSRCKRKQWLIKTTVYVREFPESQSKEKKLSNQLPIWLQSNEIRNRMITILNGNTKKLSII